MDRRRYLALMGTVAGWAGCVTVEHAGPETPASPTLRRDEVRCGDEVLGPGGGDTHTAGGAWPTSQHDERNTGYTTESGTAGCGRVRWRYRSRDVEQAGGPRAERLIGGPTVVDGTLYVTGSAGTLYAVDAATGAEQWRYGTRGGLGYTPTVVGGVIYFSTGPWLQAVDLATREERWADRTDDRYGPDDPTGTNAAFAPTVVDGTVYLGSNNGLIRALDAETGARRWTERVPLPLPAEPVSASNDNKFAGSPAVADGVVYAANENGVLYALDHETGEEVWSFDTRVRTRAAATVANGRVFMATLDNLHELDRETGAVEWELNDGDGTVYGSPAVADGTLYVVAGPSREALRLTAVDLDDHSTVWTTDATLDPALYIPEQASPSVTADTVYVPVLDTLRAFDRATGRERWRLAAGDTVTRSPAVVDGLVCAVARDGHVYGVG